MNLIKSTIITLLFLTSSFSATLYGVVTDYVTGDPIIGVNVWIPESKLGAASNMDGEYRIDSIPPGKYQLFTGMIGCKRRKIDLEVTDDNEYIELNINLYRLGFRRSPDKGFKKIFHTVSELMTDLTHRNKIKAKILRITDDRTIIVEFENYSKDTVSVMQPVHRFELKNLSPYIHIGVIDSNGVEHNKYVMTCGNNDPWVFSMWGEKWGDYLWIVPPHSIFSTEIPWHLPMKEGNTYKITLEYSFYPYKLDGAENVPSSVFIGKLKSKKYVIKY